MSKSQTTRRKTFYVRSVWDSEAGVFYCESNIVGLHIEAQTLDEFEALMNEFAPDLIIANHIDPKDFATIPLRDLIPAWQWQKSAALSVAA
jgi:Domain of unknown function (DUF1902)